MGINSIRRGAKHACMYICTSVFSYMYMLNYTNVSATDICMYICIYIYAEKVLLSCSDIGTSFKAKAHFGN